MKCPHCGAKNKNNVRFCNMCGMRMKKDRPVTEEQMRTADESEVVKEAKAEEAAAAEPIPPEAESATQPKAESDAGLSEPETPAEPAEPEASLQPEPVEKKPAYSMRDNYDRTSEHQAVGNDDYQYIDPDEDVVAAVRPKREKNYTSLIVILAIVLFLTVAGIVAFMLISQGVFDPGSKQENTELPVAATIDPSAEKPTLPPTQAKTEPPSISHTTSMLKVPNVVGKSQSEGEKTLKGMGFVVTVTTGYSDKIAKGKICAQDPPAGVTVDPGAAIKITLSKGAKQKATEKATTKPTTKETTAKEKATEKKKDKSKDKEKATTAPATEPPEDSGENNTPQSGEYFMPDTATRYISADELAGLSSSQIQLAINEIYARHGMIFGDKYYSSYFNGKSWYNGNTKSSAVAAGRFNEYELENVKTLYYAKNG